MGATVEDARVRAARLMRENGARGREIAEHFGVSLPTVTRWTKPGALERDRRTSAAWKARNAERNRQRDNAYARSATGRGICESCGMPKGIGNRKGRNCQGCVHAIAEVRRTLTEGMWADGWTYGEMAAALGVGTSYFPTRRLRDGWDLPHRRTPEQVERMRTARNRHLAEAV